MNDRYLFRAKRIDNGEWTIGNLVYSEDTDEEFRAIIVPTKESYMYTDEEDRNLGFEKWFKVDESTICQCTSLKDKAENLIWENDILMCHNNPTDLIKAVFGEFAVIDVDSLEEVDGVIGWHYKVIPTDELSKCEPFCLSMPLTDFYIDICDMKVVGSIFDNPELLEVE